jgi:hypothetical protein
MLMKGSAGMKWKTERKRTRGFIYCNVPFSSSPVVVSRCCLLNGSGLRDCSLGCINTKQLVLISTDCSYKNVDHGC